MKVNVYSHHHTTHEFLVLTSKYACITMHISTPAQLASAAALLFSETWQTDNWHVEAPSWQSWHCLSLSHHTTPKREIVKEFYYNFSLITIKISTLCFLGRCIFDKGAVEKTRESIVMHHKITHGQVQV